MGAADYTVLACRASKDQDRRWLVMFTQQRPYTSGLFGNGTGDRTALGQIHGTPNPTECKSLQPPVQGSEPWHKKYHEAYINKASTQEGPLSTSVIYLSWRASIPHRAIDRIAGLAGEPGESWPGFKTCIIYTAVMLQTMQGEFTQCKHPTYLFQPRRTGAAGS